MQGVQIPLAVFHSSIRDLRLGIPYTQSCLDLNLSPYYDMYARHDVIIESACVWLEDVNQFNTVAKLGLILLAMVCTCPGSRYLVAAPATGSP